MGLFDRVSRVVRSNLNAMVGAAEDPEKILEQAIVDMQEDLVQMRQAVAKAIASQKRVQQQANQASTEADKWHKRAQLALQKGDESLAREALTRKKAQADAATGLQTQLTQQTAQVDLLRKQLIGLEGKISEAKTKKDMLKARVSAAKANEQLQSTMGNLSTGSAMGAFERMEEKVLMMEAKSQAAAELAGADLESQFASLESSDVDFELEAMKQSMLGGSTSESTAQLPSGTTQSVPQDSAIDAELEDLKTKMDSL